MKRLISILLAISLIIGCSKESDIKIGTLKVRLTDAPGNYDEVWIKVIQLSVNFVPEIGDSGWNILNVNTGFYNLLNFTNGLDTLILNQELPAGKITQMRLILGDNNKVKKDGVFYNLSTPSGKTSGIKFNLNAEIEDGIDYEMWMDFDASRSIVEKANGKYSLKPVIRIFTKENSGTISGMILPKESMPHIYAISENNDTIGTKADKLTGEFLLKGLSAGNYSIEILPVGKYQDTIINNVIVETDQVYHLDTILVRKIK